VCTAQSGGAGAGADAVLVVCCGLVVCAYVCMRARVRARACVCVNTVAGWCVYALGAGLKGLGVGSSSSKD